MRLMNPFLFIVQAVLFTSSPVLAEELNTDNLPNATTTAHQVAGDCTARITTSGHGRSTETMCLTNPFLFIVQAVLFTSSPVPAEELNTNNLPNATTTAHQVAGFDISFHGADDCLQSLRGWRATPDVHMIPTSSTSPTWVYLRDCTAWITTSGHGGSTKTMRLTNPFLFIVQV
ncbi:uncharacterized protein LOC142573379 [Dermacentor variabilis]|uniref:uncharacterized protein LOC142573379 n=1 Tax=Dermacentor variabilis TaxID=34621 RepID=UPI003F5BB064